MARYPKFLKCFRLLAVLPGVFLLAAPLAAAQGRGGTAEKKIDRKLRESLRERHATHRVIVTVNPGCRADMRKALEQHGDVIKFEHALIDALSAEAHSEDVEALANNPCVRSIAADAVVYSDGASPKRAKHGVQLTSTIEPLTCDMTEITFKPTPNVLRETLGLLSVASAGTMTGATGIGIVIIDSGIAPSADFTGRITGFYDFTRGGISTAPFDDFGHGTHVAGLIGSTGKLSNYEFQGIAPDVRMIGLKVLDSTGHGTTSDVIRALEFTIANKLKLGAHIVNVSLGHQIFAPAEDDPLVQAVEKASAAGLIVVVSAGNQGLQKGGDSGYAGISSPGNAPSAITVGAAVTAETVTRDDDGVAPYSSSGPTWFDAFAKPDVVAPGHRLASDTSLVSYLYKNLPGNHGQSKNGQPVLLLSGSSMAAAVTSGVVALVLQQHNQNGLSRQKALTPNLMKAMLQFSAIPVAGADYLTQGTGQINAAGAIALAKVLDTSRRVGQWWLSTGVSPSSTIGSQNYSWSRQVIWGDDVLTGNLLYYNSPSWSVSAQWGGDNIVWGTVASLADDNIVWGTTEVWAADLIWSTRVIGQMDAGDNIVWGTRGDDNIVWGTLGHDNIVWGTWSGDNIVWGTWSGDNIVWGTDDNIVWGTHDNIVWGTDDNIVWGTDDNTISGAAGIF